MITASVIVFAIAAAFQLAFLILGLVRFSEAWARQAYRLVAIVVCLAFGPAFVGDGGTSLIMLIAAAILAGASIWLDYITWARGFNARHGLGTVPVGYEETLESS